MRWAGTIAGFWRPVYEQLLRPLMAAVTERGPYPPSPVIRKAEFLHGNPARRDRQRQLADHVGRRRRAVHVLWRRIGLRSAGRAANSAWASPASPARPATSAGPTCRSQGERTGRRREEPQGERHPDGGRRPLYVGAECGQFAAPVVEGSRQDVGEGFKLETSFGSPTFLNFGRNYAGSARWLCLHLFAGRPQRLRERQ